MSVIITPITLAELPRLRMLGDEFYNSSEAFYDCFKINRFCEVWEALLKDGNAAIWISTEGNHTCGAIGGFLHRDLYGEQLVAEEMFWFVSKQDRGRGAGIRLYKEFEKWAMSRDANVIQMVHLNDSMPDKLESFYYRLGYSAIETRYAKRLK